MDREISTEEKRKELRKRVIRYFVIGVVVIGTFIWLITFLKGAVDAGQLQIGTVDRGSIDLSVNASGKLTPLIEEIIVSPINSRILEVYKNPGDSVRKGEALLKLELSTLESEYGQMLDKQEMQRSKLVQVEISLENKISELEMQKQIKEMNLEQYYAEMQGEHYLDSIGASTVDKVRRAELVYEEAKVELVQLDQKIENERKHALAEMRSQELELSVFEKSLGESRRLLKDAGITAPKDATLTFINNEIGAQVTQGAKLAVISDLTSFKVNAEIADGYAEKLSLGGKALIEAGNIKLEGTIVNITPSSVDGVINFTVVLDDASHPGLRSGLRADVNVQWGLRSDVLRMPYGSFHKGEGLYEVWVIRDGKGEKRSVRLGESSFQYIEVKEGLAEGEQVIVSDMSTYKNKRSIKVR